MKVILVKCTVKPDLRGITCVVPRPHYSARPKRLASRGPSENVRAFLARSPRIRHRNELTDRDLENAIQGLGKDITTVCHLKHSWL